MTWYFVILLLIQKILGLVIFVFIFALFYDTLLDGPKDILNNKMYNAYNSHLLDVLRQSGDLLQGSFVLL